MTPPPDLLAPDFYADIDGMHDAFRSMRAEGPVWRDEKNELWAVVRARADSSTSSGTRRCSRAAGATGRVSRRRKRT